MKSTLKVKALLASATLVAAVLSTVPAQAAAVGPICDGAVPIQKCQGTTSDGAPYVMVVPANFNGTVALYSHGYRLNVPVAAIGYPAVLNTPEPAPGGDAAVMNYFLSNGMAIMGSGFARQGWNADSAIATNVELISTFKTKFPKTEKVVAWGISLGGVVTQGLAEKYPNLVSAVAPLCTADNVAPEMTMAGDLIWGMKALFDPTIKGGNYSAGTAGVVEAATDLGKVSAVLTFLKGAMSTGAWPTTSSAAGKALEAAGVPSRSALLLIGLMAGIPTLSAHFDGVSGPDGALKVTFPAAISPALGVLENAATAAVLGIFIMHDLENQTGGVVFDNSKTDYAARIADERVIYNTALSGNTAINGILGVLAQTPRVTASADAVKKLAALHQNTGKINVPTVQMVGVADPVTPAGASGRVADLYVEQFAAEKAAALAAAKKSRNYIAPKNKLLTIWNTTPAAWTTFDATGAPDASAPAAQGTNHCNFTSAQYIAAAKIMVQASKTGSVQADGPTRNLIRRAKNLKYDPLYQPQYLKYYSDAR